MSKPTVDQLNDIQRQWMEVDSNGPKTECDRVCKLMETLPRLYVSTSNSGRSVCMLQGQPCSDGVSFKQAMDLCVSLCRDYQGGRTDVVWNGSTGQWQMA